jgi:hypothetical protein
MVLYKNVSTIFSRRVEIANTFSGLNPTGLSSEDLPICPMPHVGKNRQNGLVA